MVVKLIVHSSVSVNGYVTGFEPDMGAHYDTVLSYHPDGLLVGSNTIVKAIESVDSIPSENQEDFVKPVFSDEDQRPYWLMVDSRGVLRNLHFFRRSGYCKDIILLVSKKTPADYLDFLQKRQYDIICSGCDYVDYKNAFQQLSGRYGMKTIVVDSGGTLVSVLLAQGLVDELSLLVYPVIVEENNTLLFKPDFLSVKNIGWSLLSSKQVNNDLVLLRYKKIK